MSHIEEISLDQFCQRKDELLATLEAYRDKSAYYFSVLLVTDVTTQSSLMLVVGDEKFIKRIDYPCLEFGIYELRDIVSRKKRLLSYLTHCLHKTERVVEG